MSCSCGWSERGETLATAYCDVHKNKVGLPRDCSCEMIAGVMKISEVCLIHKSSSGGILALIGEIRKTAEKAYKKAEEDESADGYTASRLYARASMAEYIENKVRDAVKRGGL